MKKIILTGASGFLGGNFIKKIPQAYTLTAIYNSHPVSSVSFDSVQLDLTDINSLKKLVERDKPDIIIHLAASSDTGFCENNPDITHRNNIVATENIVEICRRLSIHLVFTSSDMVFDGKKGNYSESDETKPLNTYGRQKLEAEKLILSNLRDAAVCRMPLMYGETSSKKPGLIQNMRANFLAGKVSNYFSDEYRSPLFAEDAVSGLLLAANEFSGLYHLGGPESISRHAIATAVAKTLGFSESLALGVKQSSVKLSTPRPKDASLNSSKAYSKGFNPMPLHEALKKIFVAETKN